MKIGFTTSLPIEVIYAAGHTPIDLNNLFITDNPMTRTADAENSGLPRNICSWIKGIYDTVLSEGIKTVIGVVQGDCSNTHSLMSLLKDKNIEVITFSFPYQRNRQLLKQEISRLREYFSVTEKQVQDVKAELDEIRRMLKQLDILTYQENKVTGKENHYWLVSSSDFFGNPMLFKKELSGFLNIAASRKPQPKPVRLAYIGVPPIIPDFYDFLADIGIAVVFNEVQRQFSMPALHSDILDQYLSFTYPYSVFERIDDILPELKRRNIAGIISYSQAFCHRQIDNILLKKYLKYPFLTIEGDLPDNLDERTKLRIESFNDMIRFAGM